MHSTVHQSPHTPHPILKQIKTQGEDALTAIYQQYRKPVLGKVMNDLQLDEERAVRLFQQAVLIFYKNILHGTLTDLEAAPEEYLFEIVAGLHQEASPKKALVHHLKYELKHERTPTEQEELIAQFLNELKPPCRKILAYFYHQQRSLEWIAEQLELGQKGDSAEEVRKCMEEVKMGCLEQLKGMVAEFYKGF